MARQATQVFYGMCGLCEQSCHTPTYKVGSRYYHERCYAAGCLLGGRGREYIARSGAVRYVPATPAPTIDDAVERLGRLAERLDGRMVAPWQQADIAAELRAILAILREHGLNDIGLSSRG